MGLSGTRETLVIPAAEGRAFDVVAGERFELRTPAGAQAADFFAFDAHDLGDWLSPSHTWTWTRTMTPREGQELLSRRRRPMLRLIADRAGGAHDMFIAACDQARYEQLGHEGPHRNCSDNLREAMAARGYEIDVVPQPVNFFTHTEIDASQRLVNYPNPVPPGGSVVLEALIDLVCVVSSCPYDLCLDDWPINAEGGVTELEVVPA